MITTFANLAGGTTTRVGDRTNVLGRTGMGKEIWLCSIGV